ncbi:MAG: hypothetical protein CM15mP30_5090 [Pelagibacteraceae bacterium]|nr:MAG: hypothetical protein CM15mP30_5090 [Pelagibacteraceae bacterium]
MKIVLNDDKRWEIFSKIQNLFFVYKKDDNYINKKEINSKYFLK